MMRSSALVLLLFGATVASADVSTTVFCRDRCADYLQIADALMPACDAVAVVRHLECGTVVSCDLADAAKERPAANATNASCCYHTVIKQKGDCESQKQPEKQQAMAINPSTLGCATTNGVSALVGALITLLVAVVLAQFACIVCLLGRCRAKQQKISAWSACPESAGGCGMDAASTQPILLARPLPLLHY